jgi:hypothetical protein
MPPAIRIVTTVADSDDVTLSSIGTGELLKWDGSAFVNNTLSEAGIQAQDAGLDDIAGLAVTDGNFIVGDGGNWVAESGDTARTSLGVGTGDSPAFTGVTLNNTGLHLLDTNASHDLIIAPGSDLTGDRTLTLTTGDAARTVTINGNPTLNDWFDQSVKQAASPTFGGMTLTGDITATTAGGLDINLGASSGDDFTIDTNAFVVEGDNANVGIGIVTPAARLHVATTSTSSPRGIISGQHSTGTDGARLHLRKSRGTATSPTVVVTGDNLGRLVASGYDGSNFLEMGAIEFAAEGTVASTRVPTRMAFYTATDAAPSVLTERMRIGSNGLVGVNKLSSVGAQLHVVSSAAGTPPTIIEHASTPSSDYLQIRTNGASTGDVFVVKTGGVIGVNRAGPARS